MNGTSRSGAAEVGLRIRMKVRERETRGAARVALGVARAHARSEVLKCKTTQCELGEHEQPDLDVPAALEDVDLSQDLRFECLGRVRGFPNTTIVRTRPVVRAASAHGQKPSASITSIE